MTFAFAGRYFNDLRSQDPTSKLLVVPAAATVYVSGTSTVASLWTDRTMSTAASNPVTTGVADGVAGISATGNLLFFAVPGDYDIALPGRTLTVSVGVDQQDVANISAGTGSSTTIMANGTVVGTQPAFNIIGLTSSKVVNNTGSGRVDANFATAATLLVAVGDTRTITNQSTVTSGVTLTSLTFACQAGHTYLFDGAIYFESTAAAGFKLVCNPPSGSAFRIPLAGPSTGQTNYDVTSQRRNTVSNYVNGAQSFGGSAASSLVTVEIGRSYLYTPSAGNMTWTFCQWTATTDTTLVADGSGYSIVDITP